MGGPAGAPPQFTCIEGKTVLYEKADAASPGTSLARPDLFGADAIFFKFPFRNHARLNDYLTSIHYRSGSSKRKAPFSAEDDGRRLLSNTKKFNRKDAPCNPLPPVYGTTAMQRRRQHLHLQF
jgi:hypothetical protein